MKNSKSLSNCSNQKISKDKNINGSYEGIKMRLLEKYKLNKGISLIETTKNGQEKKRRA